MITLDPKSLLAEALKKMQKGGEPSLDDEFPAITTEEVAAQRGEVDPELSAARRVLAANSAQQVQNGMGAVPDKASARDVRKLLAELGLPVGDDPKRIDDPTTKKSLEKAIGKGNADSFFGGDMDLEAMLGMLQAKAANIRPPAPPPPPRPTSTSPSRGLSGSGAPVSSSSGGSAPAPTSTTSAPAPTSTSQPTAQTQAPRDPDAGGGKTITVQKTTSVDALAQKHDVNPAVLQAANPKLADVSQVQKGEKVFIPNVDTGADKMAAFDPGKPQKVDGAQPTATNPAAKQQMQNLLETARADSTGKSPDGYCLKHVQDYLDQVPYGKGKVDRLPMAKDYANYLNEGNNADKMGLQKLDIDNPYEAPPGAIVVVRAGTPGTSHPEAGDIAVKGEGDKFYNGGEMSYGGPQNFPKGNDFVLGVYVPKGGAAGGDTSGANADAPVRGMPGTGSGAQSGGGKGVGGSVDIARTYLDENVADLKVDESDKLKMESWVPNNVNCANFVGSVLEQNGLIKADQKSAAVDTLDANLQAAGWTKHPIDEAKKGDVLIYRWASGGQHTELATGNGGAIGARNINPDGSQRIDEGQISGGPGDERYVLRPPAGAQGKVGAQGSADGASENGVPGPLQRGDDGPAVKELQAKLKERGFEVPTNGRFDARTQDAVSAFNREQGIDGDKASRETQAALHPLASLYATAAKDRTHEVQPGETIDDIARDNNVSVALLRQANPALDQQTVLRAGQELHVPGVDLQRAPQAAYDAAQAKQDPTSRMGALPEHAFNLGIEPALFTKPSGAIPPPSAGLPDVKGKDRLDLKPLGRGDEGRDVGALQQQLKARGFEVGKDGKYDDKTAQAVEEFNSAQGLPGGDRASIDTLRALNPTGTLFGRDALPSSGKADRAGGVGGDVNVPKSADAPFGRVDLSTEQGRAVFREAAKLAGLPPSWADSPGLRALVDHESGGIVGRPNYTYGDRANDPSQWGAIHDEIRAGQRTTESTATGLGQLLDSNVDTYYPAGRKGIGDPVQEAAGMMNYIKQRYGNPEIAWGNHSANPNRHNGVPVLYSAEGY